MRTKEMAGTFPNGTDAAHWRKIHGQEIGHAILKTLLDLKKDGNRLADSVYVMVMLPETDGTMKSVSVCLADGERGKQTADAVNRHFGLS